MLPWQCWTSWVEHGHRVNFAMNCSRSFVANWRTCESPEVMFLQNATSKPLQQTFLQFPHDPRFFSLVLLFEILTKVIKKTLTLMLWGAFNATNDTHTVFTCPSIQSFTHSQSYSYFQTRKKKNSGKGSFFRVKISSAQTHEKGWFKLVFFSVWTKDIYKHRLVSQIKRSSEHVICIKILGP